MESSPNQWPKDEVAQNARFRSELVQIARHGAKGDTERVRIQVMRLIRALRGADDDLAETLQAAAFQPSRADGAPPASVVRRAQPPRGIAEPVPADLESRLDLLRVEEMPVLPHPLVQEAQVIARLDRLVLERKSITRLAKLGLLPPKAVLLTGPPGVGKTMAARHVSAQMNLPLLVLDLATVISSYLGKTGNNIKQAFAFAQRRPCVLFLDELDAVAKRRDDDADVGELKRLVTVLLQEIDLWGSHNLLLAATNHNHLLDTAVLRRFDEVIHFPRPKYDDLCRLADALALKNDPLPAGWARIVARMAAGTSQSDFVSDLNRLRRSFALGGKQAGLQALQELASTHVNGMPKEDRKALGACLVDVASLSQRDASAVAGIARETLRTVIKEGA